jgi:uroporphyrinogen-III synthase
MRSLVNKILAITRSEHDAEEFSRLVSDEGGRSIALPTIEVLPSGPEAAKEFLARLQMRKHDYCAFMSSQAVDVLFDLADRDEILSALDVTNVVAVGPKTRMSLEEHGVKVKLMPTKFSSGGLVELFSGLHPVGKKIIVPRSGAANEWVVNALSELGMTVDAVLLYTVRACSPSPIWHEFLPLLKQGRVDALVFTSASSVDGFFDIVGKISTDEVHLNRLTRVISIGPLTSSELRKKGMEFVEADVHTVKGTFELVRGLVAQ